MTAVAPARRTCSAASGERARPHTSWPRVTRTLISSVPRKPSASVTNTVARGKAFTQSVWMRARRGNSDRTLTGPVRHLYVWSAKRPLGLGRWESGVGNWEFCLKGGDRDTNERRPTYPWRPELG